MESFMPELNDRQPLATSMNVQPYGESVGLFLDTTPINKLIPVYGEFISTIKSLVSMAGQSVTVAMDLTFSDTPGYAIIAPHQKTIHRIMVTYHKLIYGNAQTPFCLSSETLRRMVERIDCLPKALGYLYPEVLQRECEMIVPTPIQGLSLEELVRPLQFLRQNKHHLQCAFLEVALVFCAMFCLVRQIPSLALADWSPFVAAYQVSPLNQMPSAIAKVVEAILAAQAQDADLQEPSCLLQSNGQYNQN